MIRRSTLARFPLIPLALSSVFANLVFSNLALAEENRSIEEVIPTTVANLQGHKALYEDGWFIISSSEKALSFAKKHSIDSSAQAISKARDNLAQHSADYFEDVKDNMSDSGNTIKDVFVSGTERSQDIVAGSHELAKKEWAYSQATATGAWQSLVSGYVYLGQRTQDSRTALMNVPSDYVDNVSDDFSELGSTFNNLYQGSSSQILGQWDNAYSRAVDKFQQGYAESGKKNDAITGLWTLLVGYGKGIYQGLFKPAVDTSWQTAKFTVKVAGSAVFLPVASSYILTKNTLQSSGMAIYYVGKTGVEVVSPTLKSGYLASLSLLSAGAVPITYVTGTSVGVINQVGSTVAAPVAGVAQGIATTTRDTLKYGTLVTYDALTGTTRVFLNQVKSGVVLGYNALTALPAHVLLGSVNSVYFLVWDGPKLAIATVKGDVNFKSDSSLGALPVGSVIDLKTLQEDSTLELEVISQDAEVIHQVLEQLPKDLQTNDLQPSREVQTTMEAEQK
jgi:hypothetical protein